LETKIEKLRKGSKKRQRERLAEIIVELDDGKVCELVARKSGKLEQ
jgi:hypothetical protein